MFLTAEFSRLNNPFLEFDESGWSQVELALATPWYFCDCIDYVEGKSFKTTLFLTRIAHILDLTKIAHRKIENIYLISPAYFNKSSEWKMDKISKILLSTNHSSKNTNPVYKIIFNDNSQVVIDECVESNEIDYKFKNILNLI